MKSIQYSTSPHACFFLQGTAILTGLAAILMLSSSSLHSLLRLAAGGLLILSAAFFFYVPFCLQRIHITVTDTKILIDSGVFLMRSRSLLLRSLQLSSVIYTPLSRYTGLNFVPLHAYGSTLLLPFLSKSDAMELHTFLSDYLRSHMEDSHAP